MAKQKSQRSRPRHRRRLSGATAEYPEELGSGSDKAMEQVFAIPDLFEYILLLVDMKTLLTSAQRVCRQWHDAIEASKSLQRHLFFQPSHARGNFTRTTNPLLYQHFTMLLSIEEGVHGSRRDQFYVNSKLFKASHVAQSEPSIADMRCGRKSHLAFARAGATWRKMLVFQPPVRNIGFLETEHRDYWTWYDKKTVIEESDDNMFQLPDGLRMGQLWDTWYGVLWDQPSSTTSDFMAWRAWKQNSEPDGWCIEMPPAFLRWAKGLDMVIAGFEVTYNVCNASTHAHRDRDKCIIDRYNYLRKRERKSQAWMFRSDGYIKNHLKHSLGLDSTRIGSDARVSAQDERV